MSAAPVVSARMSDEELIGAFIGGSEEAYSLLVGKYKNPLVNYAYRILGDYDDALDVVQETFVRLHAKAHMFKPVGKFSTWIYTITANLARTDLRRRKWRVLPFSRGGAGREGSDPLFIEGDPAGRPDRSAERTMKSEAVQKALLSLPGHYREAVVLFYIEDLPYEEICSILGLRIGTLKSRLNRGRAMLEKQLGDWMDADD